MELYIDRDELVRTLARVQSIVERRSTNPSLSHVLLRARQDGLQLVATDTEVAFLGALKANVVQVGESTVDAASLFQIARSLPENTVHLKLGSAHRMEVTSGQTYFRIPGLPTEEYPPLPPFESLGRMALSAGDLRRAIEQVSFSVATDDTRYGLNGVHLEQLESESAKLRAVGTDGHRLSASDITFQGTMAMPQRMLLPRKGLSILVRLLDLDDQEVQWDFGEGAVQVRIGEQTLWFRLLEGLFPDYRAVVPDEGQHKHRVTLRRDVFTSALKRVAIFASDKTRAVRFEFTETQLEMRAQNVDRGEARERLEVELEGAGVVLGFNVRYFLDILGVIQGDTVELLLGDPLAPCVVREKGGQDALFVVMPMRLD